MGIDTQRVLEAKLAKHPLPGWKNAACAQVRAAGAEVQAGRIATLDALGQAAGAGDGSAACVTRHPERKHPLDGARDEPVQRQAFVHGNRFSAGQGGRQQ